MFKITQQQLDALEKAHNECENLCFLRQLTAQISETFPEEVWHMSEIDLENRIWDGIRRAIHYKIEYEEDVAAFVCLTFELGCFFDSDPKYSWTKEYLDDPTLSGQGKVGAIRDVLDALECREA